jgi:23S rRNA pseudouridine1911/1915/1917 synthase
MASEGEVLAVTLDAPEGRVDKALAARLPEISRARLQALIAQGMVTFEGVVLSDPSAKAQAGDYAVEVPPAAPAEPQPENIPLTVLFEDEYLILIDKPPGMAVHPAPGSESGTLVNALLHHCGSSLTGVGGVARPGIVHRIDKDTSGVMVAAKTDAAHQGCRPCSPPTTSTGSMWRSPAARPGPCAEPSKAPSPAPPATARRWRW